MRSSVTRGKTWPRKGWPLDLMFFFTFCCCEANGPPFMYRSAGKCWAIVAYGNSTELKHMKDPRERHKQCRFFAYWKALKPTGIQAPRLMQQGLVVDCCAWNLNPCHEISLCWLPSGAMSMEKRAVVKNLHRNLNQKLNQKLPPNPWKEAGSNYPSNCQSLYPRKAGARWFKPIQLDELLSTQNYWKFNIFLTGSHFWNQKWERPWNDAKDHCPKPSSAREWREQLENQDHCRKSQGVSF